MDSAASSASIRRKARSRGLTTTANTATSRGFYIKTIALFTLPRTALAVGVIRDKSGERRQTGVSLCKYSTAGMGQLDPPRPEVPIRCGFQ
ncbi:hypothetical protein L596_027819 [Steinernema carpocapsae]|uniref:Uncharacterized protein n=1 Tax=Steinernema carpocapsae TaxID=34508 RepID=A0A4U5LWN8_STECR|nr:hypothetical protein L596_027819 [Steinernema carpocapsae]